MNASLATIFPVSPGLAAVLPVTLAADDFPAYLAGHPACCQDFTFLPELASLELACHRLAAEPVDVPAAVREYTVNPSVRLLETNWTGLPEFLRDRSLTPQPGEALVLLYRPTASAAVVCRTPSGHDLLALKMVEERIDSRDAAREAGVTVGRIDDILIAAATRGLLLAPRSTLVREASFFEGPRTDPDQGRVATFTLQWHLTQACDLHCRHCYDRSSRASMDFARAVRVLDQLYEFSRVHHVHAQVSFSGGNPMLHPQFYELYREATDRGFLVALLGNPMQAHHIERLLAIARPAFYQVSLEGLRPHNDYIRGEGHFDRTLGFLDLLRDFGIYRMVMLTLTRENCDQVLDLAEVLRGRVDLFTFNRLAMVGEGAALASVEPERFASFLAAYLDAADGNPALGLKDNFFNLLLTERGRPLSGGCTGFGCGAAFNFVAVLPDGEVHACRKFPSPIGDLRTQSLLDIYDGEPARRYRAGSAACRDCDLRPVCRGCAAVTHGFGLDVCTALDPYCFRDCLPRS